MSEPMRAKQIKFWRHEHRRIEQRDLAAVLGISLATLRQWEQGRYQAHPLLDFALKYLDEHPEFLPQTESRGRTSIRK